MHSEWCPQLLWLQPAFPFCELGEGFREAEDASEATPDFNGDESDENSTAVAVPAKEVTGDKDAPGPQICRDQTATKVEPSDTVPPGRNSKSEPEVKTEEEEGPWVPTRVKKALQESATFDEFRTKRPFRFLHMFSGERDKLGASIKEEAKKARLAVYVESLDRKKDSELNLASQVVYDEIEKTISEGNWDGFHSGFPCGSFAGRGVAGEERFSHIRPPRKHPSSTTRS